MLMSGKGAFDGHRLIAHRRISYRHKAPQHAGWPATLRWARRGAGRNRWRAPPARSSVVGAPENGWDRQIEEYLKLDVQPQSRVELQDLFQRGEKEELRRRLFTRLEFGTAGLRGLMGAGYNRMNRVTVQQTTQGLCQYLQQQCQDQLENSGVVIGFDARRNSREFAQLAAAVFRSRGVRVWLFPEPVPTPHVAAALVAQACAAGVMITASHNPKDYNGYKVYWSNGCQIIPPHDAGISSCILNSLALWPLHASDAALAAPLVRDPSQPVAAMYRKALSELRFRSAAANAASAPVVYTPLHGVGWQAVRSAFSQFALPEPIPVPEQKLPDENFPTVQFPNPEEGAGVWQLSISTAEEHGAMLLLANDPDADRMAAMEAADSDADGWADAAAPREERWRAFTGNEIGVLLAHWLWTNHVRKLPAGSAGKVAMLSSVVSSHMLAAMAAHEGFRHEETLTGFKWLGNRACDLELEGYTVLFAFEEAIGYMPLPSIKDKDGIAAAVVFAEMAASLYASGTTVARHLRALQDAYGHFQYRSGYLVASRPGASRAAFDRLRAGGKYREAVGGYPVASVRDLGMGLDTSQPNRKPDLPWSESDMMITFTLAAPAEGAWITLRASGTEPKLKYYLEVCGADAKQSAQLADALEAAVAADLLHPGGSTGLEWPGSDS